MVTAPSHQAGVVEAGHVHQVCGPVSSYAFKQACTGERAGHCATEVVA